LRDIEKLNDYLLIIVNIRLIMDIGLIILYLLAKLIYIYITKVWSYDAIALTFQLYIWHLITILLKKIPLKKENKSHGYFYPWEWDIRIEKVTYLYFIHTIGRQCRLRYFYLCLVFQIGENFHWCLVAKKHQIENDIKIKLFLFEEEI